jgi:hypothetical protein
MAKIIVGWSNMSLTSPVNIVNHEVTRLKDINRSFSDHCENL